MAALPVKAEETPKSRYMAKLIKKLFGNRSKVLCATQPTAAGCGVALELTHNLGWRHSAACGCRLRGALQTGGRATL